MKNIFYLLFTFVYLSEANKFCVDQQKNAKYFMTDYVAKYRQDLNDERIIKLNYFVGALKKYAGKDWEFDDLVVSFYVYLANCDEVDKKEVARNLWRIRILIPESALEEKDQILKDIREFAEFILK